ncbi:MAG TPA: DUF1707 domain-containing protein [Gaiellales bacterium]|nr:DUF1707 domain-containing protein [Gaiellales bacterium]
MDDSSTLASNADRDRVVARLAEAHVDGRLTVEELDHLTGEAHAARTLSDLDLVCAHLPAVGIAPPARAEVEALHPFSGGQIAGATALTLLVPAGRLIGLIIALSLMRGETLPERRRLLQTWAAVCAVVLVLEIVAVLVFVVHV